MFLINSHAGSYMFPFQYRNGYRFLVAFRRWFDVIKVKCLLYLSGIKSAQMIFIPVIQSAVWHANKQSDRFKTMGAFMDNILLKKHRKPWLL